MKHNAKCEHGACVRDCPVLAMSRKVGMTGAEQLWEAVRLFSNCNQTFLDSFTCEELILLYRAYKRSECDIAPDKWTEDEIESALAGTGIGALSPLRRFAEVACAVLAMRGVHDQREEVSE
jgi:hypothetical protein